MLIPVLKKQIHMSENQIFVNYDWLVSGFKNNYNTVCCSVSKNNYF